MSNYNCPITHSEEVADIACMNKAAFCTFKTLQKSFFYVLNEKRVNAACTLLLDKRERDVFEICLRRVQQIIPISIAPSRNTRDGHTSTIPRKKWPYSRRTTINPNLFKKFPAWVKVPI